jgi:hypothetical protein
MVSSLRTQGPIRRAVCFERRCLTTLMQPLTPVVMGPCVRRDDDSRLNFSNSKKHPAARSARGLPEIFLTLQSEGAGNTGCALHPRSRVQNCTKTRTRAYRFSGGNPAFPAQWLYGLSRALPGDRALLPPSPALPSANLTPASGCQDHTSLPSACEALSSAAPPAAIASHPAYATIMTRPSVG